jgi:hypothetical protein
MGQSVERAFLDELLGPSSHGKFHDVFVGGCDLDPHGTPSSRGNPHPGVERFAQVAPEIVGVARDVETGDAGRGCSVRRREGARPPVRRGLPGDENRTPRVLEGRTEPDKPISDRPWPVGGVPGNGQSDSHGDLVECGHILCSGHPADRHERTRRCGGCRDDCTPKA